MPWKTASANSGKEENDEEENTATTNTTTALQVSKIATIPVHQKAPQLPAWTNECGARSLTWSRYSHTYNNSFMVSCGYDRRLRLVDTAAEGIKNNFRVSDTDGRSHNMSDEDAGLCVEFCPVEIPLSYFDVVEEKANNNNNNNNNASDDETPPEVIEKAKQIQKYRDTRRVPVVASSGRNGNLVIHQIVERNSKDDDAVFPTTLEGTDREDNIIDYQGGDRRLIQEFQEYRSYFSKGMGKYKFQRKISTELTYGGGKRSGRTGITRVEWIVPTCNNNNNNNHNVHFHQDGEEENINTTSNPFLVGENQNLPLLVVLLKSPIILFVNPMNASVLKEMDFSSGSLGELRWISFSSSFEKMVLCGESASCALYHINFPLATISQKGEETTKEEESSVSSASASASASNNNNNNSSSSSSPKMKKQLQQYKFDERIKFEMIGEMFHDKRETNKLLFPENHYIRRGEKEGKNNNNNQHSSDSDYSDYSTDSEEEEMHPLVVFTNFALNGSVIVTCCLDQILRIFCSDTCNLLMIFDCKAKPLHCSLFSRENFMLVSTGDGLVHGIRIDLRRKQIVKAFPTISMMDEHRREKAESRNFRKPTQKEHEKDDYEEEEMKQNSKLMCWRVEVEDEWNEVARSQQNQQQQSIMMNNDENETSALSSSHAHDRVKMKQSKNRFCCCSYDGTIRVFVIDFFKSRQWTFLVRDLGNTNMKNGLEIWRVSYLVAKYLA